MRKLLTVRRVTSVLILGGLLNLASCTLLSVGFGGSALGGKLDGEDHLLKDHRHRYTKVSAALSPELRAVCDVANPQSLQRSMLITSVIYAVGGVFFLITCRTLQRDMVAR